MHKATYKKNTGTSSQHHIANNIHMFVFMFALFLKSYFLHCMCTWDVLVLYAFVLYFPEDGDLSLNHVVGFMCIDDLYKPCALVCVYGFCD
jgi:hypothetical protein